VLARSEDLNCLHTRPLRQLKQTRMQAMVQE
jgi:hypothetical protein